MAMMDMSLMNPMLQVAIKKLIHPIIIRGQAVFSSHLNILNNKAQVMIEFLLTFSFTLGLVFLFIKLSLNSTSGSMAHYATFVASRRYLVADNGGDLQTVIRYSESLAKEEFDRVQLGKYGIKSKELHFLSPVWNSDRETKLFVGAYFEFKLIFSFFSFVGGNKPLNLVSESFIGKEITRRQCFERLCQIFQLRLPFLSVDQLCASNIYSHTTVYDDGC